MTDIHKIKTCCKGEYLMTIPVIRAVDGFFADSPELTELLPVPRGLARVGAGIL